MSAFGCTCSHEHTEIREELDELRAGLMLPGAQECVTCGFSLQKMVMRASDGAVGMKHNAPLERCPNGHGYLVGVTYERAWRQMVKAAEEAITERERLRALAEELAEGFRDMRDNYDHDDDSHRHGNTHACRVCKATALLQRAKDQGIGA